MLKARTRQPKPIQVAPKLMAYTLTSKSHLQPGTLVGFSYRKDGQNHDEYRIVVVTGSNTNLIQGHDLNRDTQFRAFKRSRITSDISLIGNFTSPV